MSAQEPEITQGNAPTCYRHPQRVTWVSCGRCGRPLCPDCMHHGPVGIRCAECLLPPGMTLEGGNTPEHIGLALGVAFGEALCWCVILVISGLLARTYSPNLLLSGIAGGMVGWTIWRLSGRAWNALTVRYAVICALLMPLVAAVVLAAMLTFAQVPVSLQVCIQALFAMLFSGFFAYLMVKRRR